jgi:ceramide glucosyltransferase
MTVFLMLWLAAQLVSVAAVCGFLIGFPRPVSLAREPKVAVVVAIKGHGIELDGFLAGLFDQDYADYRVIFAVEVADDPAVPAIETWRSRFPGRVALAVAGLSQDEGQKTTNLRAALPLVTAADEVLIFADADIWMDRDWMKRLVAPLVAASADVVSGFTWLVLRDRRLSSLVLASMSAGLATLPRLPLLNAAWGGSTALFRRTFEKLGMAQAWQGTLSDDLQLTNLAQRAGCRIVAPREVLPRTIIETQGFAEVAAQARRWYMLVRVHMPATYALTVTGLTFGAAGWLAAMAGAAVGNPVALQVLAAGFACAVWRDVGRAILVARLWGRAGIVENLWFLLADPAVAPFATMFNAGCGWSALAMRRTIWAGITYEIRAPQRVKVLSRRPEH